VEAEQRRNPTPETPRSPTNEGSIRGIRSRHGLVLATEAASWHGETPEAPCTAATQTQKAEKSKTAACRAPAKAETTPRLGVLLARLVRPKLLGSCATVRVKGYPAVATGGRWFEPTTTDFADTHGMSV
jgi:hypothetical protein